MGRPAPPAVPPFGVAVGATEITAWGRTVPPPAPGASPTTLSARSWPEPATGCRVVLGTSLPRDPVGWGGADSPVVVVAREGGGPAGVVVAASVAASA